MTDLGDFVKQKRETAGLSRRDLALKIRRNVKVVALYEHGSLIPTEATLVSISRALGVKYSELLELTPAMAHFRSSKGEGHARKDLC